MTGVRNFKSRMLALLIAFPGAGQAADSLMVFRAGDTAKASAVNANFRLLWERLQFLAAENRLLSTDNLTLKRRVDSLEKAKLPPAADLDSLNARIAGMNAQIQTASAQAQGANSQVLALKAWVDSAGARMGGLAAEQARLADSVARLSASLAGKANASHTHPVSQVAGLQDSLKARLVSVSGPLRVCSGVTDLDATWTPASNGHSLYIDINTSACGFTETPKYISSVSAVNGIGTTTGASSVHDPDHNSFRIHIANRPWAAEPTPPNQAAWQMQINWVAIGK